MRDEPGLEVTKGHTFGLLTLDTSISGQIHLS